MKSVYLFESQNMKLFLSILTLFIVYGCTKPQTNTPPIPKAEKVVIDSLDNEYGYYCAIKPLDQVKSVLLLLPGFGQKAEDVFLDTKFHEFAIKKKIMVVSFAGRMRLTADSIVQGKLNLVLTHIIESTGVQKNKFVLGGFSAGGVIALRYTELCHQYPEKFPIEAQGVFMVDSPIDLFYLWKMKEEHLKNNYSQIAVDEAKWINKFLHEHYAATPSEAPETYVELSPFSIDKKYGTNEESLSNVAVRAYHDIDIMWRLSNRNQPPRFSNFITNAELINRLLLMGNEKAEFIQTYQTGYRRDGQRHPHSWSIVDQEECIDWMEKLVASP